ncbi:hypothetical protein LS482_09605 [Sinomicrobium kalidii]|uniref:hypothetical protein n=1 Tax=Sinomicrobium kalidii TaxID=2900738 RepID=UPI001E282C21|nr:hypothetical protein [Sinomicrobium kalidii]UGU18122.1 hypothetical protein LS482_09605 [Sinomicrobium kalidii]
MKRVILLFLMGPVVFYAQTNTFPASGSVGIGTTTPEAKLDVAGVTYLKGAPTYSRVSEQLRIGRSDQNIRYHSIYSNHTGSGYSNYIQFRIHNGNDDDLTEQVTAMTLTGDGNVGIGAEVPGSWKLAVNGKIRAKEIKVETGWSDFVFKDDYDLPALNEVKQHIEEKGHLKDIPSAKEVEENGIFLGEMDAKLLQKIEELTLYTIRQQEIIEKQGKMIQELKLQIEKLTD